MQHPDEAGKLVDQAHSASEQEPATVRILIIDDHEILAASLAHVLDAEPDLETVGIAGSLERGRVAGGGDRAGRAAARPPVARR